MKEFTLNRKVYEKARKMDHHTMAEFFKDAFMRGYAEGKKTSLQKDELRAAIMGVKGVGEKKPRTLCRQSNRLKRERGIDKWKKRKYIWRYQDLLEKMYQLL